MAMKTDNSALEALRVEARSNPRTHALLSKSAARLAQDILKGSVNGEKAPGAIRVTNAQGNPIGWLNGRGKTRQERAAFARAVLNIAQHKLAAGEISCEALDRVEYVARAVSGKRQGERLTVAEMNKIRAGQGSTHEVDFLVQTLVYFNAAAPAAAFEDFSPPEEAGLFDIPAVEHEELNLHSVEDDLRANEERNRSDNKEWAILKLDGEVAGLVRTFGGDDRPDVDNVVDPDGFLRRLDEDFPLTASTFKERRQQQRESEAYRQRMLQAKEDARLEQAWARLGPEKAAAARARYEQRKAAFAAKRREEALARAAAAEEAAAKLRANLAAERAQLAEMFGAKGSSRRKDVLKLGATYSDDPIAADDQLTDSEIRDIMAVVGDSAKAVYQQRAVLDEETSEVLRESFNDSIAAPQTDLDLLEESAADFHGEVVLYEDLDVENALRAVPGLAKHVRKKRKANMPKGLLGALAHERLKHAANQKRQAEMLDGILALEKALDE